MQNVQSTALNRVECPYADPFFLLPDGLYILGFSHGEEEARLISNFLPIIDTVIEYDKEAFRDHVETRLRYFPDCIHRRQSSRHYGLRQKHGAVVYSAEAHLRCPDQRKVYRAKERDCGFPRRGFRLRDCP